MNALVRHFNRLRRNIGFALIGRMEDVDAEVEAIYSGNWPKHKHYDDENKARIRAGLIRAHRHVSNAALTGGVLAVPSNGVVGHSEPKGG